MGSTIYKNKKVASRCIYLAAQRAESSERTKNKCGMKTVAMAFNNLSLVQVDYKASNNLSLVQVEY